MSASQYHKKENIRIFNESKLRLPLNHNEIHHLIHALLKKYQFLSAEINIVFMSDESLRDMKKTYCGEDVFTDIISFTFECQEDYLEGELYISLPRVRENAALFDVSIRQECVRILIHGFLHLIGYDDETTEEKNQMLALENQYLKEYGYA
ncbi:MAG: rRNA maturation RNase YbeY [Candidatus Marinimicrobia bacterium]|nr:rRNA maturation RNase YbeY [Candidatus Neomarinimicrobiota bacterium]